MDRHQLQRQGVPFGFHFGQPVPQLVLYPAHAAVPASPVGDLLSNLPRGYDTRRADHLGQAASTRFYHLVRQNVTGVSLPGVTR